MKNDYLFCSDRECDYFSRLCCKKCYTDDNLHENHKNIIISEFIKSEENELGRIFNETFIQVMKECNNDINQFIEMFNGRIDKTMDEREEEIRTPIEKIINQSRVLMEEWKKTMNQKIKEIKGIKEI